MTCRETGETGTPWVGLRVEKATSQERLLYGRIRDHEEKRKRGKSSDRGENENLGKKGEEKLDLSAKARGKEGKKGSGSVGEAKTKDQPSTSRQLRNLNAMRDGQSFSTQRSSRGQRPSLRFETQDHEKGRTPW